MASIVITPIAKVYGELIIKGAKQIEQVPAKIKDQVRQYLTDENRPDLVKEGDEA